MIHYSSSGEKKEKKKKTCRKHASIWFAYYHKFETEQKLCEFISYSKAFIKKQVVWVTPKGTIIIRLSSNKYCYLPLWALGSCWDDSLVNGAVLPVKGSKAHNLWTASVGPCFIPRMDQTTPILKVLLLVRCISKTLYYEARMHIILVWRWISAVTFLTYYFVPNSQWFSCQPKMLRKKLFWSISLVLLCYVISSFYPLDNVLPVW